jgi:hypothetical protein
MVKAGGETLLSSQSRVCPLVFHPQILRKSQDLFGREVDLVETGAIRNPYFLRSIAKDRVLLYAA